jgi:glycine/D-amino acid oxidase-like deaminating enzyme
MTSKVTNERAVVIGAGVIGVNVGLALLAKGFSVTIVDPLPPGTATSFGNAGCFATAEIAPISMPGLVWSVPAMLLDPLGPLSIRWRSLPTLAPWLWRFLRSGNALQVERATAALASLAGRIWEDWTAVIEEANLGALVQRRGALFVYETEKGFAASNAEWSLRLRHDVQAHRLTAAEIRELEPGLAPIYRDGYFIKDWGHTVDPGTLVGRLADHFRKRGGKIVTSRAERFIFREGRPQAVQLTDGTELDFERLVIATGAWSKDLCRQLGQFVPLDTERGYNTTLPDPGVTLQRPVCCAEQSFVMTPMAMGLRIGGAVELANLTAPPNLNRAKALLRQGQKAIPGLNTRGGKEWMGCRPSMPDSLPVIGRSPQYPDVLFAFGHGHLGLTQGATTGKLIGELARRQPTTLDVAPFRIERFDGRRNPIHATDQRHSSLST